jgi:hypothetical protein
MPQQSSKTIRIIATPPGQAPLWVREKWVGPELPLAPRLQRQVNVLSSGVLDGSPTFLGFLGRLFRGHVSVSKGFAVEIGPAIAILEVKHPDAANWWKTNTPHLIRNKRSLLFQKDVCEQI